MKKPPPNFDDVKPTKKVLSYFKQIHHLEYVTWASMRSPGMGNYYFLAVMGRAKGHQFAVRTSLDIRLCRNQASFRRLLNFSLTQLILRLADSIYEVLGVPS